MPRPHLDLDLDLDYSRQGSVLEHHTDLHGFYLASDAMHFCDFSAKRGHGIAMHDVCLSVRLSVTLVDCDHISWNSWKIISRLISVGFLLSVAPTSWISSKWNISKMGRIRDFLNISYAQTCDTYLTSSRYDSADGVVCL